MLDTIIDYLKGKTCLEKVVFCLFTEADYRVFEKQLKKEIADEGNASW
jgi:O-acetyl-ADP-ribose deacetylase (regulator of RNase III)